MANTWVEVRELAETNAAVTTLEDVLSATVCGGLLNAVTLEVKNTGSAALTDFTLLVKAAEDSLGYQTLISSTGWATAGNTLRSFVGAPHTLAAGASAFLRLDLGPVYAFKLQASCGTTTSTAITGYLTRM